MRSSSFHKLSCQMICPVRDLVEAGLRTGQAYMKVLNDFYPECYVRITGTNADPFYLDENLDRFWEEVSKYLEEIES